MIFLPLLNDKLDLDLFERLLLLLENEIQLIEIFLVLNKPLLHHSYKNNPLNFINYFKYPFTKLYNFLNSIELLYENKP
jgi:hypothetical protein